MVADLGAAHVVVLPAWEFGRAHETVPVEITVQVTGR